MLSSFSNFQKKIWDKWNIRMVILFSLFLQIFLIVSAPSRKRTRSFFVFFVWLAYLIADWAAGYCVGLISNNQEEESSLTENDYLMAFWAPFLLLHLGGPDTITAFALEDNELWLRHFLGLLFQSLTTAYVFLLTIPRNTLWLPTVLMFLAGLIKYAERTHALYLAAIGNFRKSLLPDPEPGPNYAKLMEEHSHRQHVGLPAKIIMIPELDQTSNKAPKSNAEQNGKADKEYHRNEDLELVQKAYFFFQKFKGLIVDMIYSFNDRLESREYFENRTAEQALMLIEIELNFMYEVFYTKGWVVRQYRFWFWGKFVSLIFIVAALGLFISTEKHGGFHHPPWDVKVTYALLYGALVLDVMALLMRFFNDYTATLSDESLIASYGASFNQRFQIRLFKYLNEKILTPFLKLRRPNWGNPLKDKPYEGCKKLSNKYFFRRWSGSISGHNLLRYCLDESLPRVSGLKEQSFDIAPVIQRVCFRIVVSVQDYIFYQRNKRSDVKDLLDRWKYESENPFLKELWEYIFEKVKKKSNDGDAYDVEAIQSICSARGERVVQEANVESLKPFVDPNEVAFDQSLLLWHIATKLCDAGQKKDHCDVKDAQVGGHKRQISMLLSDYMLYLLVMQPNMMSAIAGIGQIRFQDTCEEAKKFFSKRIAAERDREAMLDKACKVLMEVPTEQKPIDVKGDRSKSVLFDACRLAKELEKLRDDKWEIISCVWVELLSYAACHCRPTGHVQLLSKGGELISFVWLLMVHLGLGKQFQIKDGDARAKLIVGKFLNPELIA